MKKEKKILYAITTYDAYAYIDLSITMHKKFGNDVIVIDDGSCSEKLHNVCIKHNVPLFGLVSVSSHRFDVGDVISTVQAIQYAYLHGYTHVVKQSRRWICLENPTPSLSRLIDETNGATFSNITTAWGFGFRTEFCAYDTSVWINVIKQIYPDLKNKRDLGLVEHYIHVLAQNCQPQTDMYKNYVLKQNYASHQSGYIHWQYMGTDKSRTPSYILWHNANSPNDYLKISKQESLPYQISDFTIIDSHKQKSVI